MTSWSFIVKFQQIRKKKIENDSIIRPVTATNAPSPAGNAGAAGAAGAAVAAGIAGAVGAVSKIVTKTPTVYIAPKTPGTGPAPTWCWFRFRIRRKLFHNRREQGSRHSTIFVPIYNRPYVL